MMIDQPSKMTTQKGKKKASGGKADKANRSLA
jgi:hypothetical protein